MELVERVESFKSRSTTYSIYPIGDVHLGLDICDEEELEKTIGQIKGDNFARWFGMGEICDLIVPGDKRFDYKALAPWVDLEDVARSQYERALELFDPIREKSWGFLNSNHDETMRLKINRDVYSDLVRELGEGLPEEEKPSRFGFECFLNTSFRRTRRNGLYESWVVHFWLHHGWFGGRLMGETALNLERLPQTYDADIYVVGHGHKGMVVPLRWLTARLKLQTGDKPVDGDCRVLELQRWALMSGSWLRVHQEGKRSWHERRGFKPQLVGCPIIKITPATNHRRIEVVV